MNRTSSGLPKPVTVARHLKRQDKTLAAVVRGTEHCPLFDQRQLSEGELFRRLARSIVGQQLSTHAARGIWQRIAAPVKGRGGYHTRFLSLTAREAKKVGLSRQKTAYLQALAECHRDGGIRLSSLRTASDEAVVAQLCTLSGVGLWTSEMFLISCLKRLDIFSLGDAGLRRAICRLYQLQAPADEDLLCIAEHWRPYRSVASWHLWHALDNNWIE